MSQHIQLRLPSTLPMTFGDSNPALSQATCCRGGPFGAYNREVMQRSLHYVYYDILRSPLGRGVLD